MNTKDMFEVFPDMKQEHQDEAQERWGNTEAWKQSAERWSQYTKTDVKRMKLEMTQVYGRLENVFALGARPDAPEALEAIEAMRLLSDKWFYDTSKEMHVKGTEFVSRDQRFVRNIDKTINDIDPETGQEKHPMNTKEMFEVFPDMKQEHQDEAQERWGNTEAWKQSAERWSQYTKADMERMKSEMTQAYGRLENVFASGARPDAPEALAAIEALRLLSDKWFYDTSKEMHVKGTEFVSRDERFVRNIDKNCAGLAAWIHEAAKANLQREA